VLRVAGLAFLVTSFVCFVPGRAAAQQAPPAPEPPDEPAAEPAPPPDPWAVQVHAFVSQGYIKTTDNNYLAKTKTGGSTEFAEAGLNVTKAIGDRLRLGVQLFTRDLGPIGNYSAKFDWFYLDYRLFDYLGLRAGRVKLPVGLYNEINDVDAARVSILLPQSVYSTRNRDFLLAQTGAELYGYLPIGAAGALDYRLYGGTIFLEVAARPSLTVNELNIPYVVGGRLLWETPLTGLRVGGSVQALRLDFTLSRPDPVMPIPPGSGSIKAVLWVASAEYLGEQLLLAAEYGRWHLKTDSQTPLVPASKSTQERFYVMGAYRLLSWLTPGIYVSALYPNVDDRDGSDMVMGSPPLGYAAYQHTLAATLRFDITANWLFKLEAQVMNGTAELDQALNGGTPRSMLTKNWLVFMAKTTLYF
jgi:hypothetical protein